MFYLQSEEQVPFVTSIYTYTAGLGGEFRAIVSQRACSHALPLSWARDAVAKWLYTRPEPGVEPLVSLLCQKSLVGSCIYTYTLS
jgi:hypothetical protein